MEDGAEQPISYASRTLTSAKKKYSQLDKEALAVVYGVTKFHQYLYGRDFTLFTDHKPLTYLFSSDRAVPQMASSRLQRWALTLSSYRYSVVFRRGRDDSNADALSRLPLMIQTKNERINCPKWLYFLGVSNSNSPTGS